MATLATDAPTFLDLANLPANKDAKEIINLVARFNPILQDAPAIECNRGTYHETTMLVGLPAPTWGRLYKGIPATKGSRQTVKDTPGFLESAAEVDTRLVDVFEKAEDKASIRFEEAQGHLEAMAQEMASAIFYHDTLVNPEKPMGFAPRFNSLTAENGGQVFDGGGNGNDNTSMWMITWDKMANHLIYPKGYMAGIKRTDRGAVPKLDGGNNTYFNYREEFSWHLGISVRDWRYVCRGANIDISELTTDASAGANIINMLTDMYYAHYGRKVNKGKTCIYVNTTIAKYLDYQARTYPNKMRLTFAQDGVNASEVLHFRGVPIRECDALLNSEDDI
jgi:hypothetical protein